MESDIILNYPYPLTLTITQPCIIILILHISVSISILSHTQIFYTKYQSITARYRAHTRNNSKQNIGSSRREDE